MLAGNINIDIVITNGIVAVRFPSSALQRAEERFAPILGELADNTSTVIANRCLNFRNG